MDNQKIAVKNDTTITKTEDHVPAQMPVRSAVDSKCFEQFTDMALDTGRFALHIINENSSDYKMIDEDQSMSSVDKALNKRKVLATDVCIGLGAVGGTLGLIWLGKKVFTA